MSNEATTGSNKAMHKVRNEIYDVQIRFVITTADKEQLKNDLVPWIRDLCKDVLADPVITIDIQDHDEFF